MGRYRRGQKWRGKNRKRNSGGDGSDSLAGEADWILIEKYLVEYRALAFDLCQAKEINGTQHQHGNQQLGDSPVLIGSHQFLPLTAEVCRRPYIDLPDTLGGKERRKIHALCASLDLYHDSAGDSNNKTSATNDSTDNNTGATEPTLKRRIVISIYADGFNFVPDFESQDNTGRLQSFPRTCRPWYNLAYGKNSSLGGNDGGQNCPYKQQRQTIEGQKQEIRQFANLPEKTLRTSEGEDDSFGDSLDLRMLDSFDLSGTPTPEETPWMLVDTVDKLKLCVDEMMYGVDSASGGDGSERSHKIRELAFDLEMYNPGPNSQVRTCLIQITSDVATTVYDEQSGTPKEVYKDYIIDPLAPGLWDAIPTYLGPLFSNPKIVKIGHGIGGMDTSSLHRDFGMLVLNAFDTYEASCILTSAQGKKNGMGLATLCRHYGLPSWQHYKDLKHTYQTSDWRRRPLCDGALQYGRYDIRFLVSLRKLLMRDLVKMDMIGAGYLRFGSSLEDDSSGLESASGPEGQKGTSRVQSLDPQSGSTISSTVSSFSENEVNNTAVSSSSLGAENTDESLMETENSSGDALMSSNDSGAPPVPSTPTKSIIYASEFPCYHHLMKAISMSQKRCLKLWSGDEVEPIMRNPILLSMVKEAANQKGHGKHWSDANMQLYKQLAEWRVNTALEEVCSVAEVCSLDLLVHVAYKLPTSRDAMRRFSYVLPALLEDESLPYCDEMCNLVTSSDAFKSQTLSPLAKSKSMAVIFYSNTGETTGDNQEQEKKVKYLTLLLGSAVIGGIFLALIKARRR